MSSGEGPSKTEDLGGVGVKVAGRLVGEEHRRRIDQHLDGSPRVGIDGPVVLMRLRWRRHRTGAAKGAGRAGIA